MADYTVSLPTGEKVTVRNGPEGATRDQIIEFAKSQYEQARPKALEGAAGGTPVGGAVSPPGRLERIGKGFMDPIYGGAQVGAHMGPQVPGAVTSPEERATTASVDRTVREREEAWEARTEGEGLDPWAILGTALNPQEYVPAILGGLPGAALTGAYSGLTAPAKDFAGEKPGQVVGGTVVGTGLGVIGKTISAGLSKVGQYLAREYPENVVVKAVNTVRDRFEREARYGGPSAETALRVINEAQAERGKPMVLADTGEAHGPVRGLAGKVARTPEGKPVASSVLEARDRGANARVTGDLERYIYSGETGHQTAHTLIELRDATSRPLYDEAMNLQGVWSPEFQERFLNQPELRRGMARGLQLERLASATENRPFNPTQLGVDLDAEGNIVYRQTPNMRVLDMGKRGLDAMIADERNEQTGRLSSLGRELVRFRRAYVDEIDSMDRSGVYRAARAAWEGPTASLDAVRAGQHAFEHSPEEIAQHLAELSPANREFYRIGVADRIRERLLKADLTGADDSRALVTNGWTREQLRPLLRSDAEFDSFMQAVTDERTMFAARQEILRGSQTAERGTEDAGGPAVGKMARHVSTGHYGSALRELVRPLLERFGRGTPEVNEAIARILFGTPRELEGRTGQMLTAAERPQRIPGRVGGVDVEALGRGISAASPAAAPAGGEAWREFAR